MGSIRDSAAALATGTHAAPHDVLGAHPAGASIVIRAWQPGARAVTVVTDAGRHAMRAVGGDGLYEVRLRRSTIPAYRFVVERDAHAEELGDPYRFLPTLSELDLYLIGEGRHERLWEALGARCRTIDGVDGVSFAIWAPGAHAVSVVGDRFGWDDRRLPLRSLGPSGVWELFVPDARAGDLYKLAIRGADGSVSLRADPLARRTQTPPETASVVASDHHVWGDASWMASRGSRNAHDAPISTYEVHLGSWRQGLSYRDLAGVLPAYVADLGFTHVELMPVMEHPFGGSWGYQVSGYYAPTARLGSPDDLRFLIDAFHQHGIGVILDWVPGHFPRDTFALARLDGTSLYEHDDPRRGSHPDWGTLIFNYGRHEVRNFLVANALYWLEEFHADGLRVDAVASMLYLDYSRTAGQWLPNEHGGRENLEAIAFLRELNSVVYGRHPDVMMVAEESTAWPGVSRPVHLGGLGFGFKWNMGYMNDTLAYFGRDPVYRKHHHRSLTFPFVYAFAENYVLPVSHDEVVHGKGSLLGRMPGDTWQRFANHRCYLAYTWANPGKKLVFMGCEIAQASEWDHDDSIDWGALDDPLHRGVQTLVRDANRLLRERRVLFAGDCEPSGFRMIDGENADENVVAFARLDGDDAFVCVANLAPVPRTAYRLGLPHAGRWSELLNTDATIYGGSGVGNLGVIDAEPAPYRHMDASAQITLPPLAVVWFGRG
jgi:1,4-alpha-glucan branching enzyme